MQIPESRVPPLKCKPNRESLTRVPFRWKPPHLCGGTRDEIIAALAAGLGSERLKIHLKMRRRRIYLAPQSRRRIEILFRRLHVTGFHRIHPDIFNMLRIVPGVRDSVFLVSLLPDLAIKVQLLLCAE